MSFMNVAVDDFRQGQWIDTILQGRRRFMFKRNGILMSRDVRAVYTPTYTYSMLYRRHTDQKTSRMYTAQ
jgi:hypothetical protein